MSTFPYDGRFDVHRRLPEQGTPRAEILDALRTMSTEEDAAWESGKCSGTMYCGDHEHYALHERGLRHVRPRERAPAGHLPQRHQVRGGDHRHDPRPPARRGRHRRRAGRTGGHRRHRAASATPCSPTASMPPSHRGIGRPNVIKPETAHPGVRQGLPPVRHRAEGGSGRPGHHPGRHRVGRSEHRRRHRGHHRIGLQLRLRDHRPDRIDSPRSRCATGSGSTSTAASAGSSSPSARSSATTSLSSTSVTRA